MENSKQQHDYVSAIIHRHFYCHGESGIPTLIKEYDKIEKIFNETRYIACITIQIPHLHKVEYSYGSEVYNHLLSDVSKVILGLKEASFRDDDMLLADLFDIDTYIIFLSSPRKDDTQLLDHVEDIASRIRRELENKVFHLFYPYTKEYTKPAIGFSLMINNPMINNMRLIMQLVTYSKKMGEFEAERQGHHNKFLLQKVILNQDVSTVFQPVVDARTLQVLGYEALSRGPKGTELASPQLMFMLASEYGLTFELDSICRKVAFRSARKLDAQTKIFVNTLPMTIHDPEFRGKYLEQLLKDLEIKPENVIFEVNERLAIDNYDLFKGALKDYSDIGIVHANDDIGHGYADLERIMELNPGFMKLDMSLVRDINESYIKQQIVKAMINLAKGINSQIIAEGVETMEEFILLRDMGVDYIQGYLFGRPSENPEPVDISRFKSVMPQE